MEKNERKTNYSIKSKLVSAIAMLLVATIMVVSSTYAWFTLSTAPEVTGISTAVGANGALEMLLATKQNNEWFYGTGSVNGKTPVERNTYWGNLVDLSDLSYGSQAITLYPSILTQTGTLANAPLSTPVYGPDGRVDNTMPNTGYAKFNGTSFLDDSSYFGFRGVGVASGLTERQQAFRAALSEMSSAQNNAKNLARQSLNSNGSMLANIAVLKAFDGNSFDDNHLNAVKDMIDGLEDALAEAEKGYVEAIVAFALSNKLQIGGAALNDDVALALANHIRGAANAEISGILGKKIEAAINSITDFDPTNAYGITADNKNAVKTAAQAQLLGYEGVFVANNAGYCAIDKVKTADEKATALTGGSYTWTQISEALHPIVDIDKININNIPANEVKTKKNELVESAMKNGVTVKIATGGGVYADIADLSGNYRVDINIDLNPAGLDMELPAAMITESTQAKPYFTQISDEINKKENQPTSNGAAAQPLTEFYGYVIDLAFRTNASESNLLLQTDATDRIYNGNNNEQTMGKGSNMTFSSSDPSFTAAKAKELASHYRVVFFDTDSNSIYATAKLDTANATVDAEGNIVAKLYIYKTATKYTYNDGADVVYRLDNKYYTSATCETEATIPTGVTPTATNETVEVKNDVITSLDQNQAKHISALVYLDGETIENKDVAATAAKSLTGTLNLQFASSAALVPMEYGTLHTVNNN